MKLSYWVCPICGNKLKLVAPNTFLLPNRVKETTSGRQYYFVSARRVFPYTMHPKSNFVYPAGYEKYNGVVMKEDFLLY